MSSFSRWWFGLSLLLSLSLSLQCLGDGAKAKDDRCRQESTEHLHLVTSVWLSANASALGEDHRSSQRKRNDDLLVPASTRASHDDETSVIDDKAHLT